MGATDLPRRSVADGDDSSFTGRSDSFGLDRGPIDLPPGTDLGGVTIVRLLAEGGMGRVYEGRQHAPDRPVAVKVLHAGLASRRVVRRFELEAHLLARLKHPHIAQVHMLGRCAVGGADVPFFVLELVEAARPVDDFARDRGLPVRDRVALLARFAAAVGHGHAIGVVHRDLKPGNMLVAADGTPKVIDFGVARTTGPDVVAATLETDAGAIVGTLRYMAPEQFDADPEAIDARTDVHALGLVLHELVAGDLPHDVRGQSIVVAARIVREQEPQAMRTIPRALAAAGGVSRADGLRLAAIVEKSLAKSPAGRYANAGDLADDLCRWLAGEPIRARPPGPLGRVGRWLFRHRAGVAAAAVAALSLAAAAAGVAHVSERARRQETLVERDRAAATRERSAARSEGYQARLERAVTAIARGEWPRARRLVDEAAAAAPAGADVPLEVGLLSALVAPPPDVATAVLATHAARVTAVAAAPAGDLLATGAEDGTAWLWRRDDRGGWMPARALAGHRTGVWGVAFAPDGRRVATASADRTARIWDAAGGEQLAVLRGHKGSVYGIAFAADGRRIATGSADDTLRLWNADTATEEAVLSGHTGTVFGVAFAPDGGLLASASGDGTVRLWDPAAGRPVATLAGHARRVFNVAFSPDSRGLVSAAEDGTARLWRADGGAAVAVLRHPERVNAVAFSPAGDRVATACTDGLLRLFDPLSGAAAAEFAGHTAGIWSLAPLPGGDGRGFLSGSADTTARTWDDARGAEPVLRCGSRVLGVAVAADGRLAATAVADGAVVLWDLATCRDVRRLETGAGRAAAVDFSPDGGLVAAAGDDGTVRLWRTATGAAVAALAGPRAKTYAVAFSPDGRLVASGGEDRTARIRRVADGGETVPALEHPRRVFGVAWPPAGDRLATAGEDGVVRLWPLDGTAAVELAGHTRAVNAVAFTADGGIVASCSSDGTVRLWDARDGRCLDTLGGAGAELWELAITPDGTRLAAVASDGRLHLYRIADKSGQSAAGTVLPSAGAVLPSAGFAGERGERGHLLALDAHADRAWTVACAADGRRLVTGSWDGTARVWGVSAADVDRARRLAAAPLNRPSPAPARPPSPPPP